MTGTDEVIAIPPVAGDERQLTQPVIQVVYHRLATLAACQTPAA